MSTHSSSRDHTGALARSQRRPSSFARRVLVEQDIEQADVGPDGVEPTIQLLQREPDRGRVRSTEHLHDEGRRRLFEHDPMPARDGRGGELVGLGQSSERQHAEIGRRIGVPEVRVGFLTHAMRSRHRVGIDEAERQAAIVERESLARAPEDAMEQVTARELAAKAVRLLGVLGRVGNEHLGGRLRCIVRGDTQPGCGGIASRGDGGNPASCAGRSAWNAARRRSPI